MAANTTPIFIDTLQTAWARATVANTNKDGTGTLVTIITGAADGTLIYQIDVKSEVTTTAGTARFFVEVGGTKYFWRELLMPAVTSGGTALSFQDYTLRSPDGGPLLGLKSGEILKACCNNGEATIFGVSFAGDL